MCRANIVPITETIILYFFAAGTFASVSFPPLLIISRFTLFEVLFWADGNVFFIFGRFLLKYHAYPDTDHPCENG